MQHITLYDETNKVHFQPEMFYRLINDGKCCAYIGSGVSSAACGDWQTLITELCLACGVESKYLDIAKSAKGRLELADLALENKSEEYQKYLYEKIAAKKIASTDYKTLAKLPFKSFVTSNFDEGLASYLDVKGYKIKIYPDLDYTEMRNHAFYMHGKINKPLFNTNNVIFGGRSFERAYKEESIIPDFLKALILHNDLVVIGASLEEPMLREVIRGIIQEQRMLELLHNIPKRNKTIFIQRIKYLDNESKDDREKKQQIFKSKVNYLAEMDFTVISYEGNNNNDHDSLYEFLETVCTFYKADKQPLKSLNTFNHEVY